MKNILLTGMTGQDGSYLAELSLKKGYGFHGISRRSSLLNTRRVGQIYQDPPREASQLCASLRRPSDTLNLTRFIQQVQPGEVYNLGAQSHAAVSFESPV